MTDKVYLVIEYDYESSSISGVYATRDLAEAAVRRVREGRFLREGRKAGRRATGWHWSAKDTGELTPEGLHILVPDPDTAVALGWEEWTAETFDEFVERHKYDFPEVVEYDVLS